MAEPLKHFSASDALDTVDTWRHVLIRGQKDQIDRFLVQVEQRFGRLGWSRDTAVEGQLNRNKSQLNRFYCWISRPDGPRVVLCLNRTTDRRVRSGTYNVDERTSLIDLASAIQ